MGQCSSLMRQDEGPNQPRREPSSPRSGSLTASAINRLRRRRSTDAARQDPKRPRPADQPVETSISENTPTNAQIFQDASQVEEPNPLMNAEAGSSFPSYPPDTDTHNVASEENSQEISSLESSQSFRNPVPMADVDAISDEAEFFDAPNTLHENTEGTEPVAPELPFMPAANENGLRNPPTSPPPSPPLPNPAPANSSSSSQRNANENESEQVTVLSRVLLAAATLTASHLVGEQLSHGEQYSGSNGVNARQPPPTPPMPQQNDETAANAQGRNPLFNMGTTNLFGRLLMPETEPWPQHENAEAPADADTNANANSDANANADATNNENEGEGGEPTGEARRPVTFPDFLEQLRSGSHTDELSHAMFDNNRATNFFRFFRFPADGEGRIPILLMGIRSTENANGNAPEQNFNLGSDAGSTRERSDSHATSDFEFPIEPRIRTGPSARPAEVPVEFSTTGSQRSTHAHNPSSGHEEVSSMNAGDRDPDNSLEEPVFNDEEVRETDQERPGSSNTLIDALFNDLISRQIDRSNGTGEHNLPDESGSDNSDQESRHRRVEPSENDEPDQASNLESARRNHRSWVIYVIGGAYPPTHPIFFAPSLLTDSPSYEDMLFAEQLLGPMRPPVASKTDISSAGGVFKITEGSDLLSERCPICLVDYAESDDCRELRCKHVFHKECVDRWLLKSHNSCPMCRHEGVPSYVMRPTASGNF